MEHKDGGFTVGSFVVLMSVYLGLNSSLNILNKWALGIYGFRFPFLLTSSHMAFSLLALTPFALRYPAETHRATLARQWRGVVYIGVFMALNVALNNVSLQGISLTMNQIIRSAIPVITCALAVVVEGKRPTRGEAMGVVILTLGVMATVWQGRATGKLYAIVFCIAATVCNAGMMTFSGKVMSEKLDVVRLTFYTAPVSLLCLLPFFMRYEYAAFLEYLPRNRQSAGLVLGLTSLNALAYNMVHSLMIKRTSATTTTVLGMVKIVGLLMLSAFLLGEGRELTPSMLLGCVVALTGFGLYSHARLTGSRAAVVRLISLDANKVERSCDLEANCQATVVLAAPANGVESGSLHGGSKHASSVNLVALHRPPTKDVAA